MTDFSYAATDDFQKAAAHILKFANDGLQDAQKRLASEGFFKKRQLAGVFAPSLKLLRRLLSPVSSLGGAVYKDREAAETYCRTMSAIILDHVNLIADSSAGSRRLVTTIIGQAMERTAGVLTKRTHNECWYGSAQPANELREMIPASGTGN